MEDGGRSRTLTSSAAGLVNVSSRRLPFPRYHPTIIPPGWERSDLALPDRALRRSILQSCTPVHSCRLSLAKPARLCDIAPDNVNWSGADLSGLTPDRREVVVLFRLTAVIYNWLVVLFFREVVIDHVFHDVDAAPGLTEDVNFSLTEAPSDDCCTIFVVLGQLGHQDVPLFR